FTKDIGFVINDVFFIAKMKKEDRRTETPVLKRLIQENNLKFYEMQNNIEGGDVARHGDTIFVGISTRTTIEAANELQKELDNRNMNIEVVPIHFDTSKLHLDCVFNTLDEDSGVISPYVYDKAIIKKYIKNLYEISKEDSDVLGTNLIYLGNKKVFSSNKNVVQMLNSNNYNATFIEYSEIMKAGGSLACSTLVAFRE
ncbi:MAG: dimethylarginine dimethylaminohydrolase family protein, partial [Clostridium sp.]